MYSYSFSLPEGTNIYKLANRLLEEQVAETAVESTDARVHVGPQLREVLQKRERAEALTGLLEIAEGRASVWRWLLKHPLLALRHLRVIPSRNPFRLSLSDGMTDTLKDLGTAVDEVDRSVLDHTKIAGALAVADKMIFSPIYLEGRPFIRLELRTFYADSPLLSDDYMLVHLLIHRSGAAILTIATVPGPHRDTDELLSMSMGIAANLKVTAFPDSVIRAREFPRHRASEDRWTDESEGSGTYRKLTWVDHFSITDAFFVYRDRIVGIAGGSNSPGHYLCYTSLFIDGLLCCDNTSAWLTMHGAELAGLILRHGGYAALRKSAIEDCLNGDTSITRDTSRFHGGSNAVVIAWDFSGTDTISFVRHSTATAIVENALIQFWQIKQLDSLAAVESPSPESLEKVQAKLAAGLEEYRASAMTHEGALEISDGILQHLRADRMYQGLTDRLATLQQLIAARQTRESVRRNYLLAGLGAIATIFLAVPSIKESLKVLGDLNTSGRLAFLEPAARWAHNGSSSKILAIYISILVAVFLLIAATFRAQPAKRASKTEKFGLEWKPAPVWSTKPPRYRHGHPHAAENNQDSSD